MTQKARPCAIPTARLPVLARCWLLDGQSRGFSPETLTKHRQAVRQLAAFLEETAAPTCGPDELRAFLASLTARQLATSTRLTRFASLRTLGNWLVAEGHLAASPLARLRPPVHRPNVIPALTPAQCQALLTAARQSFPRRRNVALLLLLIDSGARASEACSMRADWLDLDHQRARVLGKGGAEEWLVMGSRTTAALWDYLWENPREGSEPVWTAYKGPHAGAPMTRSGVLHLVATLGQRAGIHGVRCSPHTLRHTFALEFLRAGGSPFELQQRLRHRDLRQSRDYAALADIDLQATRRHSPVDRLKLR